MQYTPIILKAQFNNLQKTSHFEWDINNSILNTTTNPTYVGHEKKDWPLQVMQTQDASYLTVGYSTGPYEDNNIITKFSTNGRKIWEYQFPCGGSLIDVVETNLYYVASGYDNHDNSLLLKIAKDGNPASAKVLGIKGVAEITHIAKDPTNSNNVICCGAGKGIPNTKKNLILFNISLSKINLNPINNCSVSNYAAYDLTTFNWYTNIGTDFYNIGSSTNMPSSTVFHHAAQWPHYPSSFGIVLPTAQDMQYDEFAGTWFTIDYPGTGSNYNIYISGNAHWGNFTNAANNLVYKSTDVLLANFAISSTNTSPISNTWINTYDQNVVDASNQSLYEAAYASKSPRHYSYSTVSLAIDEAHFLYNTLINNGVYVDVIHNNSSRLILRATYNGVTANYSFLSSLPLGEDFRDADLGAILINKSDGSAILPAGTSNYTNYLCHVSGDDFKVRMIQDYNSKILFNATTNDIQMGLDGSGLPIPRKYSSICAEDFLIGKFDPNGSGNAVNKEWIRDVFTTGDPTRNSIMGICGFGLGLTIDNGFVISGNNNQNRIGYNGAVDADDDMCIVKFAPDCQQNLTYTGPIDIAPYNPPLIVTGITTINTNGKFAVPIVVKSSGILTIQDCRLEFANSNWLYDYTALNSNSNITTYDALHGGFVGIKVEAGGQLNLERCTLTGMDSECSTDALGGNVWDGIVVEGDMNQSNHEGSGNINLMDRVYIMHANNVLTLDGRVFTSSTDQNEIAFLEGTHYSNPGLITNSKWVKNTSYLMEGWQAKGGGLVNAYDAHFIDNKKHVCFMEYNFYNSGWFEACKFNADHHYPDLSSIDDDGDWLGTQQAFSMWQNHGIAISNNNQFNGFCANANYPFKNGDGLITELSEFYLLGNLNPTDLPNTFDNFKTAVSAAPTIGWECSEPLDINTNLFGHRNANIEGIFVNGSANITNIAFNDMKVGSYAGELFPEGPPRYYPFGIHLQGNSGYLCEHNIISGVTGASNSGNYGIVINDEGPSPNMVRFNNIDNIGHGATSLHKNGDFVKGGKGLEWKCNTFGDAVVNNIDVISRSYINSYNTVNNGTINYQILPSNHKYDQGICIGPASNFANNKFYGNCGGLTYLKLFHDANDPSAPLKTFKYAVNQDLPVYSPGLCTSPNSGVELIVVSNCNPTTDNPCDDYFDEDQKIENRNWSAELQSLYGEEGIAENLLIAGDDEQVMDFVNDPSLSNNMLKQYLIDAGPYLSDRIIKAAIERVNSPLSNLQLREVVLNNSPLNEAVYDRLEDERPIVAGNYAVIQAQYPELSPRDIIKMQLSELQSKKMYISRMACNYFLQGPNKDYSSAANIMLAGGYNLEAIPFIIKQGNLGLASNILANANTSDQADADMAFVLGMQLNSIQNNISFSSILSNHSTQIAAIKLHHNAASYAVMNLERRFLQTEAAPVYAPFAIPSNAKTISETKRKLVIKNYSDFNDESAASIYPIPAVDEININYHLKEGAKKCEAILYDQLGQKVLAYNLPVSLNTFKVQLNLLSSGIYILKVKEDNEIILSEKINILVK